LKNAIQLAMPLTRFKLRDRVALGTFLMSTARVVGSVDTNATAKKMRAVICKSAG